MYVDVAVVPVAGLGTRLLPLTRSIPKELLPLGRKPVLQHVIDELRSAGIRHIVLVTGVGEDSIKKHVEIDENLEQQLRTKGKVDQLTELESQTRDVQIHYVRQSHQLGLGHAVWCAREIVADRPFTIALGDAMFGLNSSSLCQRLHRVFNSTSADAVIAFQQVPKDKVSRYGVAQIGAKDIDSEGSFEVSGLVEKPAVADAPSQYAIAARYVCQSQIFKLLGNTKEGVGGEIQLTDALRELILAGGKVVGVPLRSDEKRFDVGNFDSYFSAFVEVACADPTHGDALKQQLKAILDKDRAQ